jgi:hypothetical protein
MNRISFWILEILCFLPCMYFMYKGQSGDVLSAFGLGFIFAILFKMFEIAAIRFTNGK